MEKIGRQVLFIGTSKGNPRNGEGSFIRLKDGSIMFAYTEFMADDWEDDENARISALISRDEGETWGEKRVIFTKPEGAKNIMSFSFLRMNNGDIGAFYIIKNADSTDQIVLSRSTDEGKSWCEPVNCLGCLAEQDYYVINNDRVVKLKNSRLIFAAARHTVLKGEGFKPGTVCFFISDDDGASWRKTETEIVPLFDNDVDGMEEPGIYELPDGRLWCYIRTGLGFQFESFSSDNGETWSAPQPNFFFTSSCSPMLVKDCGELTVAVFNPVTEYTTRAETEPWGRTPYVMAVSNDAGVSFKKENLYYVEDDLSNGYCYPAIIECEGGFLMAYYHSNNTGIPLNSTKIIKIAYDEIKVI